MSTDPYEPSPGATTPPTAPHRPESRTERERERLAFAVQAAKLGIWERDAQGAIVYWNAAMYQQRGLSPDDPRSVDELARAVSHPDDMAVLNDRAMASLKTGEPYRSELRVRRPDGEWRWLLSEGRAVLDPEGLCTGFVGVHLDITERKTAQALAADKARAEQASRDKSAFMARMSHELRTPMNAILGFARLMGDDPEQPPTPHQAERLRLILQSAGDLLTLIDTMLDIAGDEADSRRVEPATQSGLPAPGIQSEPESPSTAPQPPQVDLPPLKVLYVEDNPVNLLVLSELLGLRSEVQLTSACDGASGHAAALAERPELLLLDRQLPDIDGVELMRQLRREPALSRARFIAVSADAMPENIQAALAAGFDDYWTEPLDFERVLAGIDRLLEARRQ
ncbi:MAG: PAS domain-containing protein [Rubrivivax sp.]|nr:PAS domain-containing protein [Rubrivivax sp.]